jgi:hypothetical protein
MSDGGSHASRKGDTALNDDDMLDRPRAGIDPLLPEAVRREMERQARQRDAAAVSHPARVVPFPSQAPAPSPSPSPAPSPEANADGEVLSFEKLARLPQAADPYEAHARPVPQFLPMLLLIDRHGMKHAISYHDLRIIDSLPAKRPGHGPGLLLRCPGLRDAELEGMNLDNLLGLLYLHRVAWIRELPPGGTVKEENAIVITRMTITDAKRE